MRRPKTSPAPQGHKRPDGLDYSERPRALQEAVGRTKPTCASERQHVPIAAILQGVADQRGGDGEQAKGSQSVHGQSYPALRIHVTKLTTTDTAAGSEPGAARAITETRRSLRLA